MFRNAERALKMSLAVVLSVAGLPQSVGATATSTEIRIDTGRVEGKVLASGIRAYLGIPYAAPPVRELRWKAPQPIKGWTGIYHADRFGPQCVQPMRNALANQYSGAEAISEDCLTLNVWAKPGLKNAPVIVYIHGGAFFIGASSMPLYGGEAVAEQGAVFVNFNYRLGTLGFLAHPELSVESSTKTSGNYGFQDQIAALQWVKRNVARFGGDPDNVTIAGQSAGSMSVLALQASPLTRGLFQRAIGMSGGQIGGAIPMPALKDAEQEGAKFQSILKAKSLAEMRALPADRLAPPRTPGSPAIGPNQDGYVLPKSLEDIFAAGAQNDVPLLLGFTKDESFGGLGAVSGLEDYRVKAQQRFGDLTAEFLALYPASNDAEAKAQARAADRDGSMAVSMQAWSLAQFGSGRAPIYTYEFTRSHSYAEGVKFSDLDPATAGAYHTSEVPFWLGTLDSFNQFRTTRDWTADDRAMSRAMVAALVRFARTGNPGDAAVKWPTYNPAEPMLMRIGTSIQPAVWPDVRKFEFFRKFARPRPKAIEPRD